MKMKLIFRLYYERREFGEVDNAGNGEWKTRTGKTKDTMAGWCTEDYGDEATGAAGGDER